LKSEAVIAESQNLKAVHRLFLCQQCDYSVGVAISVTARCL